MTRSSGPAALPARPDVGRRGTNFSLFSEHAERVELCLFDDDGKEERIELRERTAFNWHGYVPGVGPGQRYAYRVHGPWAPEEGHRFNPNKLLLDPYAKAIAGTIDYGRREPLPYVPDGDDADLVLDTEDDARGDAEVRRHRRELRLAGRRRGAPADPVARGGHLRGARQGLHRAPSRRPRGPARHVRRPRVRRGDRAPDEPRRHVGRAAADPPHRGRGLPPRQGADELLGLLDDRLPRAARALLGDRARAASRCASSRGW